MLVVQNDTDKSLGAIAAAMTRAGIRLDVRSAEHDLPLATGYAGLVVLPGLADPVDESEALTRARKAIEEALSAELPVLGLCLGGQLLVQALGGTVYPCRPELGFREVSTSASASTDPLLGGAPERFSMFHAHTYAFEPPGQADVLLSNDVCVQACRHNNTWAFQCHPEVTREWVRELAAGLRGSDGGVKPETANFFGRNGVSADALERDGRSAEPVLRKLATEIGTGFAAVAARQRST